MALAYNRDNVIDLQLDNITDNGTCYVNAYIVSLGYGGAEEGGWWFDIGEPISSIKITSKDEGKKAIDLLEDIHKEEWENEPKRSSTISAGDLVITVEDHIAEHFPSERPHYE